MKRQSPLRHGLPPLLVALVAIALAVLSAWQLVRAEGGVVVTAARVDGTPATVFRPADGRKGPAVVIAHGFAGSQQLMRSFALELARSGYTAVTFDFAGHGRNPRPLGGSITHEEGATRVLVSELGQVADYAVPLGDGRLAVLGHSMASDIIVRFAQMRPDVAATVAVSMFSPVVTATSPRNMLVIVGAWEGMLLQEALRVTSLVSAPEQARPGVTYGSLADGSARRVAVSPHVEHVGVLYSETSLRESVAWLDAAFGMSRTGLAPPPAARGVWLMLLLASVVALAWPFSRLLPVAATAPAGAGLRWREAWLLAVPMVATPLVLTVVPTTFLPVLVGDYLAGHFAAYGVITALCLVQLRRLRARAGVPADRLRPRLLVAPTLGGVVMLTGFVAALLFLPIDLALTSFVAGPDRLVLALAMLAGMVAYFVADEWMTRGAAAGRGVYALSKAAFLVSLGLAVALDFPRLFFILIIVPVIVPFLLVFGFFSTWAYARTRSPLVAALTNAAAFAWALAVTFPLLAG